MESSQNLLVLSTQDHLNDQQMDQLKKYGLTLAKSMGMELAVLAGGLKAEVHSTNSEQLDLLLQEQRKTNELLLLLLQSMTEEELDPDAEPLTYMDGSPVHG